MADKKESKQPVTCPDCWGSGWEIQFVKPCERCKGTGQISFVEKGEDKQSSDDAYEEMLKYEAEHPEVSKESKQDYLTYGPPIEIKWEGDFEGQLRDLNNDPDRKDENTDFDVTGTFSINGIDFYAHIEMMDCKGRDDDEGGINEYDDFWFALSASKDGKHMYVLNHNGGFYEKEFSEEEHKAYWEARRSVESAVKMIKEQAILFTEFLEIVEKIFISGSCEGERCSICGEPAARKVGEEIPSDDPHRMRHNLTAYVCLKHFDVIMNRRGYEEKVDLKEVAKISLEPVVCESLVDIKKNKFVMDEIEAGDTNLSLAYRIGLKVGAAKQKYEPKKIEAPPDHLPEGREVIESPPDSKPEVNYEDLKNTIEAHRSGRMLLRELIWRVMRNEAVSDTFIQTINHHLEITKELPRVLDKLSDYAESERKWSQMYRNLKFELKTLREENAHKSKTIQNMQTEIDNLDRIIKNF